MEKLTQSYVHGASDVPLLGKTIGQQFDDTAARHADRDALVVCHQNVRWSYGDMKREVDSLAAGRSYWHLVAQQFGMGCESARQCQGGAHFGQH